MCAHRPTGSGAENEGKDTHTNEHKKIDTNQSISLLEEGHQQISDFDVSHNQIFSVKSESGVVQENHSNGAQSRTSETQSGPNERYVNSVSNERYTNSLSNERYLWPTKNELETLSRQAKKRKLRSYYLQQLEMMKSFQEDYEFVQKFTQDEEKAKQEQVNDLVKKSDDILTKLSLVINICLFIAKLVAAALSGSLVVLGSVIDSAMDTVVSVMIFLANRAIKNRNTYEYPRGRTRLEPIAILVVSVIMGAASIQVISKSIESITEGRLHMRLDVTTIVIMAATIVAKFVLMVVCCMFQSPNTAVLAQDHGNDCLANVVAMVCVFVANRYWIYLDPIGAIAVSVYILASWIRIGGRHVKMLSGQTARPEFINRIVKICLDHQPEVNKVDTVLVYHYGTKYLVEVHIVLDEMVTLKEAHDISEPLQRKIEYLPGVERSYVHIDYETDHRPDYEHKVV